MGECPEVQIANVNQMLDDPAKSLEDNIIKLRSEV